MRAFLGRFLINMGAILSGPAAFSVGVLLMTLFSCSSVIFTVLKFRILIRSMSPSSAVLSLHSLCLLLVAVVSTSL